MLAQAQSATEKKEIEQKMEGDSELSAILLALQATEKEDIVSEQRARRHQARQSRMAADMESLHADGIDQVSV